MCKYDNENKPAIGSVVYHVANPNISGKVVSYLKTTEDQTIVVRFDDFVIFSGNKARGKSKLWYCNPKLLYRYKIQALFYSKIG